MDELVYIWLFVQLTVSFAMLLLVLPIIFPFTKVKRWVSQLLMVVVYGLFITVYIDNLYKHCDSSRVIGFFDEIGIGFIAWYGVVALLVFIFNIVVSWIKRGHKIIVLDLLLLIVLMATPFYLNYLAESLHLEQGCEKFEPLGYLFWEEEV